jgi:hypothetical protein
MPQNTMTLTHSLPLSPSAIEAIADGAAAQGGNADIVADRQGGEGGKRCLAPRQRLADIAHRQPVEAGEA